MKLDDFNKVSQQISMSDLCVGDMHGVGVRRVDEVYYVLFAIVVNIEKVPDNWKSYTFSVTEIRLNTGKSHTGYYGQGDCFTGLKVDRE